MGAADHSDTTNFRPNLQEGQMHFLLLPADAQNLWYRYWKIPYDVMPHLTGILLPHILWKCIYKVNGIHAVPNVNSWFSDFLHCNFEWATVRIHPQEGVWRGRELSRLQAWQKSVVESRLSLLFTQAQLPFCNFSYTNQRKKHSSNVIFVVRSGLL